MSARGLVVLGLSGKAGAGKDTAGRYLEQGYGCATFSFAEPIREIVALLHPEWDRERIWGRYKDVDDANGVSSRALCQEIGAAGRRIHPDYWIWQAERRYNLWRQEVLAMAAVPIRGAVWMDVRFANEARWVRGLGGAIVRVVRRDVAEVRPDVSETSIGDGEADWVIPNNGSLELLHAHLDGIMLGLLDALTPRGQIDAATPAGDVIEIPARGGRYPWPAGSDCYE